MFSNRKTSNDDFQNENNTTSIEINYNSSNLPLWAKKELQNQYGDNVNDNDNLIKMKNSQNQSNLVLQQQNQQKFITSWSTPNNKSKLNQFETNNFLDKNNTDKNQTDLYDSQIERLKKRTQLINNQVNKEQVDDNVLNKKKNPLYISSENLNLNDTYLNKSTLNKSNLGPKPTPSLKPATLINNSNKVIQQNQKTSINNNNKPPISKRREELTRALTEARLKLQTLEINRNKSNGLSTSMSVANINRLPMNVQRESNSSKQLLRLSSEEEDQEKVRRSISLSDLSKTIKNKNSTLKVQIRNNKLNSPNNVYYPIRNHKRNSVDVSTSLSSNNNEGLWAVTDQMNSSAGGTLVNKPIKVKMSRSSSMASINKNDLLGRTLDGYGKPQGLWTSPSSLSINTLRSNTTAPTSNNISPKYNNLNNRNLRKSSDDDSSSDENDLYLRFSQRPNTPPKPNIFRQLRRSSTTSNNFFMSNNNNLSTMTLQNSSKQENIKTSNRKNWSNNFELRPAKSEYNLNSMGQDNLTSPSSGFWSNNSNGTIANGKTNASKSFNSNNVGYENFDLSVINPATIPLSLELFQHIVDELNHLATFAKKVHYRAITANNRKLCEILSEGVSKAYVNLNTIVSFSDVSNNYVLPKPNIKNYKSNQSFGNLSDQECDQEEDNSSGKNISNNNNLNNNVAGSISLTSDSASSSMPQESIAINLLQTYSERLLSMVEQHYNKNGEKK